MSSIGSPNSIGLIMFCVFVSLISKWRWGAVELPVFPLKPINSPFLTMISFFSNEKSISKLSFLLALWTESHERWKETWLERCTSLLPGGRQEKRQLTKNELFLLSNGFPLSDYLYSHGFVQQLWIWSGCSGSSWQRRGPFSVTVSSVRSFFFNQCGIGGSGDFGGSTMGPHPAVAACSLALNFVRRGHDFSNTMGLAVVVAAVVYGLPVYRGRSESLQ